MPLRRSRVAGVQTGHMYLYNYVNCYKPPETITWIITMQISWIQCLLVCNVDI